MLQCTLRTLKCCACVHSPGGWTGATAEASNERPSPKYINCTVRLGMLAGNLEVKIAGPLPDNGLLVRSLMDEIRKGCKDCSEVVIESLHG
jgi:hypothetical protein